MVELNWSELHRILILAMTALKCPLRAITVPKGCGYVLLRTSSMYFEYIHTRSYLVLSSGKEAGYAYEGLYICCVCMYVHRFGGVRSTYIHSNLCASREAGRARVQSIESMSLYWRPESPLSWTPIRIPLCFQMTW